MSDSVYVVVGVRGRERHFLAVYGSADAAIARGRALFTADRNGFYERYAVDVETVFREEDKR